MLWVGYRTCQAAELPASDEWLSLPEREVLARLTIEKRRSDFRLGRLAAKQALSRAWARREASTGGRQFCVIAAADGAPEAHFADAGRAPFAISLSHSHAHAACAVAPEPPDRRVQLGCDLELVEPRSEELVRQFFTAGEGRRVFEAPAQEMPLVATLVWSAKESALKALRMGLRADTRSVEVEWQCERVSSDWQPLRAKTHDGAILTGHWRTLSIETPGAARQWVLTLLSNPAGEAPEFLTARGSRW